MIPHLRYWYYLFLTYFLLTCKIANKLFFWRWVYSTQEVLPLPKKVCPSFYTEKGASWHGMGGILWKSPRYKKAFTKKTGFRDREVLLSTVNFTGTYVGIIQMTFLFLHSRLSVKFTYWPFHGSPLLSLIYFLPYSVDATQIWRRFSTFGRTRSALWSTSL